MNDKDFLKKLKPGDTVTVHTTTTVQKIMSKGLIKVADRLFNPETGVAADDCNTILLEATPAEEQELKERIYAKDAIKKLQNINKLTYKQAVEIMAIIESEAADKE